MNPVSLFTFGEVPAPGASPDENLVIRAFRERYPRFLYIDRIVIAHAKDVARAQDTSEKHADELALAVEDGAYVLDRGTTEERHWLREEHAGPRALQCAERNTPQEPRASRACRRWRKATAAAPRNCLQRSCAASRSLLPASADGG